MIITKEIRQMQNGIYFLSHKVFLLFQKDKEEIKTIMKKIMIPISRQPKMSQNILQSFCPYNILKKSKTELVIDNLKILDFEISFILLVFFELAAYCRC